MLLFFCIMLTAASVADIVISRKGNAWQRKTATTLANLEQKVDKIMADQTANQQDLDNALADLKTALSDLADRVGALQPTSPNFAAEVAEIRQDILNVSNIAPSSTTTNPPA